MDAAAAWLAETATTRLGAWCRRRPHSVLMDTLDAAADAAQGLANLTARFKCRPASLRGLLRRTLFSAMVRLPVIAAATMASHLAVGDDPGVAPVLAAVLDGVVMVEQVLGVLDITVIAIALQRDLGERVTPHCQRPTDPLQQTISRVVAPLIVGGLATVAPAPWLFRGAALGCQMHDAALTTRGVCATHRAERWARDGVAMIMLGVAIDLTVQHHLPAAVAPQAAQYLATLGCAVVTCQPLLRRPARPRWALQAPYAAGNQLVERLRRMVVGGVLAPDLSRRSSIAVGALKAWARLGRLGWLLPVELAQPELHYLLAELVDAQALELALGGMKDLLAAATDPIARRATRRIPVLAALVSGLPETVVRAVGDVAADPTGVAAAAEVQRHLARRLSDLQRARPLTFAQWEALGISAANVAAWDLDASLSESGWVRVGDSNNDGDGGSVTLDSTWVEAGASAY